MKHILDRSFRYIPSYETDLRATFERIRREQAGSGHEAVASSEPARKNVLPMPVRQEAKK
jgi:hypothetical protein